MQQKGPRIGVLTSGGDAQGMNAAVRAVVRHGLSRGLDVYTIHEGYSGMVAGGEMFRKASWTDVSYILHLGGTVIGTARCPEFREQDGRRQAVKNLLTAGIDRLVVIGGDGSLTGADLLYKEWSMHLEALVESGEISAETARAHPALGVVGMVGSIDNDMWGTDMTIGCDSALHRIIDAVDAVSATAASHQRSFVIEVMGRRCGYLALVGALATEADFLLIPEAPIADWPIRMEEALQRGRALGKRKSIVLVAEGACDVQSQPITAAMVKQEIEARLGYDTRITVLGHVQRGGAPSAYDRVMSTTLGARGVDALLSMSPGEPPVLMATAGMTTKPMPLMECVERTHETNRAIKAADFSLALQQRGPGFASLLDLYRVISRPLVAPVEGAMRLLIAHVGAPAPGMNAAIRAFARIAGCHGHEVLAANEGLRGLTEGLIAPLAWKDVNDIVWQGSTVLGTNRWIPDREERLEALAEAIAQHRIDGILLIGGFEAMVSAEHIRNYEARERYPALRLPVAVVPATISNNVPGVERSVGSDTALNAICEGVDRLKQSAVGSRDRVFLVEVMGRKCGYLATIAGIGTGAELVYSHESGLSLAMLQRDVTALNHAFDQGKSVGIVLVADGTSPAYMAHTLADMLAQESGGRFDTRVCVLGHLQQGGRPSPHDRIAGAQMASGAVAYLEDAIRGGRSSTALIGLEKGELHVTPIRTLMKTADMKNRRPLQQTYESLLDVAWTMALPRPKAESEG